MLKISSEPCPCGLDSSLAECCGRYLDGAAAPTAEALMRSRFVAFSLGARAVNWGDVMGEVKCNTSPTGSQAEIRNAFTDYLVQTHHPDFREPNLAKSLSATFGDITWQSLQVCAATSAGDTAQVEFIATYTTAGRQAQLQERSSFVRESGRWLYTTGEMDPAQNGLIE